MKSAQFCIRQQQASMNRIVCRAKGFANQASKTQSNPKTADFVQSQALESTVQSGAVFDKVGPGTFKGLRGLKAKSVIRKDEVMITVPRKISLWTTSSATCPFPDWVDATFFKSAPWYVKLSLKLLNEKRLGESSKFNPLVTLLPESVDLPIFWDADEQAQLQCAYLQASLAEQTRQWNGYYSDLMSSSPGCGITRADFDWAMACINSRTFKGPYIGSSVQDRLNLLTLIAFLTAASLSFGLFPEDKTLSAAASAVVFNLVYEIALSNNVKQYVLCPVIDLANHDSSLDSEVTYNYFQDTLSVAAGRPFDAGEQIFISYGKQTTDSMMQKYGFTQESTAANRYTFQSFLTTVCETCDISKEKVGELDAIDAGVTQSLQTVSLTELSQVDESVKTSLRFILGLAATVEDAREKVSNKKDAVIWQAVLSVCEKEQDMYPSTLQQDKRTLKDLGRNTATRKASAIKYNILKKAFLADRISDLKVRISKMV